MYPQLSINRKKLLHNVQTMKSLCGMRDIGITGVTKVFGACPEISSIFLEGGVKVLGDSRIANLKRLERLNAEKWLIRMPMLDEAEDVVRYADASLNSEWDTLQALDLAAGAQKKLHKVILMADLGDIREGYTDCAELLEVARRMKQLPNLQLYGVGTNLTCFSFVQPDSNKMQRLAWLAEQLECPAPPMVTGGNSSALRLMLEGGIPQGVNNLRLGESLLFGRERARYEYLPGTHHDALILRAEIIELKEKPSLPWGTVGKDSYGNTPVFQNKGCRLKAICALGKQDIDVETMWPLDSGISILGASSDHLMLDVTESDSPLHVGSLVEFRLGYFSTMRAFTSEYVQKVFE